VKEEKDVKQKIFLDSNGRLVGKMTNNFHNDIVSFARELDLNGINKHKKQGRILKTVHIRSGT
jgi:hypothetical protein